MGGGGGYCCSWRVGGPLCSVARARVHDHGVWQGKIIMRSLKTLVF